ncbi:hypothetical protein IAU60_002398 [Kwoniella sp. DSM 27419]
MAIGASPKREERQRGGVPDPVLDKLARTNTFDSDWPTLRQHLHTSLLSTLPLYLSLGPPRPYRPPPSPTALGPEPIKAEPSIGNPSDINEPGDDKPPSESLLLSPSATPGPTAEVSTPEGSSTRPDAGIGSIDVEPTATPATNRLDSLDPADDLKASTPGGLVIPPFPPLDPERRRRSSSSSSEAGPSTVITPSINMGPRMNGLRHQQRVVALTSGIMDDEYDEDVVIGGKMLPAWMHGEEGKKELERVVGVLDELDAPPFTIQRLAELLADPTRYHTSIGKFLRAVEKTLLVTTQWEPPSYVPAPPTLIPRAVVGSESEFDIDSTMPPGSTTPMFSPIPFLATVHPDSSLGINEETTNGQSRALEDGLMSPLMLSDNEGGFTAITGVRSPTPEPEETEAVNGQDTDGDATMDVESGVKPSSPSSSLPPRPSGAQGQYESIEHSDPAHQSYMGRVDELDTGPIESTAATADGSPSRSRDRHDIVPAPGTGEGGNMAAHGMSDKPVPISSTTVVHGDKDRSIASLPRSASEKSLRERFVSSGSEVVDEGESGGTKAEAVEAREETDAHE